MKKHFFFGFASVTVSECLDVQDYKITRPVTDYFQLRDTRTFSMIAWFTEIFFTSSASANGRSAFGFHQLNFQRQAASPKFVDDRLKHSLAIDTWKRVPAEIWVKNAVIKFTQNRFNSEAQTCSVKCVHVLLVLVFYSLAFLDHKVYQWRTILSILFTFNQHVVK